MTASTIAPAIFIAFEYLGLNLMFQSFKLLVVKNSLNTTFLGFANANPLVSTEPSTQEVFQVFVFLYVLPFSVCALYAFLLYVDKSC